MNRSELFYQILCIAATIGMTSYCIHKYFKNESVVSVNTKEFHDSPNDIYPSISLCFRPNEKLFVDTKDMNRTEMIKMMKGNKEFNGSLFQNTTYEDITIQLQSGSIKYTTSTNRKEFRKVCSMPGCFNIIGDGKMKCFTHDIK